MLFSYRFSNSLSYPGSRIIRNCYCFGGGRKEFATKKQRLGPKLAGAWAREASEKIGTPYLFLQPTEKLVHNRFTLLNTSVRTKLGRV